MKTTARGARPWNNANALCLSLRPTRKTVAREILDAWFNTSFIPNDTDNACLAMVAELEEAYGREREKGGRGEREYNL